MPRPLSQRNDLSKGWHTLYGLWSWNLDEKLKYSHRIIQEALDGHKTPVLCWSGGKDSTALLHLVLQYRPQIPVIFIDVGVDFPETYSFIDLLANSWNLNLIIARPKNGNSFWEVGKQYGWPIFGKFITSNVERAVRSGNIRSQLSPLEKTLANCKAHISCRCGAIIRENPGKELEKSLSADLKFIGLRASESRSRVALWVDHGNIYPVKRYYGRGKEIWKANPISIWTEDDIWKYHEINSIPHCSLYDLGYPRNGCWTCAMGFKFGQLKRLRQGHPDLFLSLITESEMGKELLRIKKVLLEEKGLQAPKGINPKIVLTEQLDFFDGL